MLVWIHLDCALLSRVSLLMLKGQGALEHVLMVSRGTFQLENSTVLHDFWLD